MMMRVLSMFFLAACPVVGALSSPAALLDRLPSVRGNRSSLVATWSELLETLAASRSPGLLYFCELMYHDGVFLSDLDKKEVARLLPPELDPEGSILGALRSEPRFRKRQWPEEQRREEEMTLPRATAVRTVAVRDADEARRALNEARARREPVLLRGVGSDWPRWTSETLATLPRAVCRVSASRAVSFCKESHPLIAEGHIAAPSCAVSLTGQEAARRVMEETDEMVYLQALAPLRLLRDLDLSFLPPMQGPLARIWASQCGVSSPTHYDATDSHLLQIAGHKRLILWPPSTLPKLNPVSEGPLARRCHLSFEKKVDPLVEATALEAYLKPGDALWFPSYWAHHTQAVDDPLSISLSLREDNGTLVAA